MLLRFEMFNRQAAERDSLLKDRMLENSYRMITRRWWQYDRALARVNDTLQYQSKYLLERFRFFNDKWADYARSLKDDSLTRAENAKARAEALIARKSYFHDRALSAAAWQAEREFNRMHEIERNPVRGSTLPALIISMKRWNSWTPAFTGITASGARVPKRRKT